MNPALQLRSILLGSLSSQGVVLAVDATGATVRTPAGAQRMAVDLPVAVGDAVTVRAGRVVAKRTGGAGGAQRIYYV